MKGLRLISVFLMLTFFLGACRASRDDAAADLAEPKLRITAPFDFLADTPELTADLDMNIVDDYALIIDPHEGTYWQSLYYALHTSAYGYIQIIPEIVEADLQNVKVSYEARTNYGAFFATFKKNFVGTQTEFYPEIFWNPKDPIANILPEHAWVDILVKAEDAVVGMIVCKIVDWPRYSYAYTIEYKYSEYYPLVDGQPQNITEDFAWQRVEAYHQYEEQKTQ